MVGQSQGQRVDVVAGNDLTEVVIGRTVAVAILGIHVLLGGIAAGAVHVTDGDDLDFTSSEKTSHNTATAAAHADAAVDDTLAGSDATTLAQGRRRYDIGESQGPCRDGGSALHELTSVHGLAG